ncbi:hypothetical protein XENTR_v10011389 [Xenopus tropicalis]|nr:hypothetical protein XENTR_v10011389 [Xenopus tropicalis]
MDRRGYVNQNCTVDQDMLLGYAAVHKEMFSTLTGACNISIIKHLQKKELLMLQPILWKQEEHLWSPQGSMLKHSAARTVAQHSQQQQLSPLISMLTGPRCVCQRMWLKTLR